MTTKLGEPNRMMAARLAADSGLRQRT